MSRRRAREYALQMLFQYEFTASRSFQDIPADNDKDESDRPDGFIQEPENIRLFSEELFRGTVMHREEIDRAIQAAAEHWQVERMMTVDRNILRLAVFELLYRKDIPAAVTIDEALEIAKKFSSQESASFINGLLDRIARGAGKA